MTDESNLFGQTASAILIDSKIKELVASGVLIAKETFDSTALDSCSYDIRVGEWGVVGGSGREHNLKEESGLELPPGGYAGLVSWEKLNIPLDVFVRLGAKRSYSYDGIILLTGTLVDPGYEGHLLFGVYNASQKRYVLRYGSKICTIVFERLPELVERRVFSNPDLLEGRIPDDFINKMANMEVLPWMQISERVNQIEQITSDILDLKQRYQDVLEPIKELTQNVDRISKDVDKLTERASELRDATTANADQLKEVTTNLGVITSQLAASAKTSERAEGKAEDTSKEISKLNVKFGRFSIAVYVFWVLLILLAGAALPTIIEKLFGS